MNALLLRYLPDPMKKVVGIAIAGAATLVAAHLARLMRQAPGSVMPRPRGATRDPVPPAEAPAPAESSPSPAAAAPASDLSKASKGELYERAQELGIKGRSKMSKAQLLQAIRHAQ